MDPKDNEQLLDLLHITNDAIQAWVNDHESEVPAPLVQLLTDLDLLLNGP